MSIDEEDMGVCSFDDIADELGDEAALVSQSLMATGTFIIGPMRAAGLDKLSATVEALTADGQVVTMVITAEIQGKLDA